MTEGVKVAVVGATGYAGYELARILLRHPSLDKPTFYLRDPNSECSLPDGIVSAIARLGRGSLQAIFGGSDSQERCTGRVSGYSA